MPADAAHLALKGIGVICIVLLMKGCVASAPPQPGVYIWSLGTAESTLVGEPAGAPAWAPDGMAVAWGSEEGVYRRDLADTAPRQLSSKPASGRVAWSPDGSAIAFMNRTDRALVVIDAQAGQIRTSISTVIGNAENKSLSMPVMGGPAWSPDGSRLAYNCWDGHGDEVCIAGADGAEPRQVTDIGNRRNPIMTTSGELLLAASNSGPPAWSSDGSEIALAVYPEQRGAPAGVFVVNVEEGTARRVSGRLPDSDVVWLRDGSALLFSAADEGRSDVLRVPRDGGEAEVFTGRLPDGARDPSISTDGARVAVASGGDIVVLDMAGRVERTANSASRMRLPLWSPDGGRIASEAAPDPLLSYS